MPLVPVTFAKLTGLRKMVYGWIEKPQSLYLDPAEVVEYFHTFNRLASDLRQGLPELYADLPDRAVPESSGTTDYKNRGYIERRHLERLIRDIDYIFELQANTALEGPVEKQREQRVFLSHGRSPDWREVQAFIERDLRLPTLELAQEPNRGRTILQKLEDESSRCSFAVIVMTGDDAVSDGPPRARENVIHEIGYFQGKFALARVCLLHEEGTSIPTNIHGVVYIPFPKGLISASFGTLSRELRAALE